MVVKKTNTNSFPKTEIVGLFGSNTYAKQEKRAFRRSNLPRKRELGNEIESMAIAILEAERHNNQLCRFNHHIYIDHRGRWVIDDEVIPGDDNAGEYIRAAKKLHQIGWSIRSFRNCPALVDPDDNPQSISLREAERIAAREY